MDRALLPVVRASRLSRSLWLVPTLLVMVLSCSFAAYVAGYFDAYEIVRRPGAPAAVASPRPTSMEPLAIIDVAPGVTDVRSVLALRTGEEVLSMNDLPGRAIPDSKTFFDRALTGGFLDITTNQRRIVVLFH